MMKILQSTHAIPGNIPATIVGVFIFGRFPVPYARSAVCHHLFNASTQDSQRMRSIGRVRKGPVSMQSLIDHRVAVIRFDLHWKYTPWLDLLKGLITYPVDNYNFIYMITQL